MDTPSTRDDIQAVIDFFAVPFIVDVLLEIKNGHPPGQSHQLDVSPGAADAAKAALVDAGLVASPGAPTSELSLTLTPKGHTVCALVEELTYLNL